MVTHVGIDLVNAVFVSHALSLCLALLTVRAIECPEISNENEGNAHHACKYRRTRTWRTKGTSSRKGTSKNVEEEEAGRRRNRITSPSIIQQQQKQYRTQYKQR